jgi:hypothetical protein
VQHCEIPHSGACEKNVIDARRLTGCERMQGERNPGGLDHYNRFEMTD